MSDATPHETRSASERADPAHHATILRWEHRPIGIAEALIVDTADATLFAAVLRDDALHLTPATITEAALLAPNLIAWSGTLADERFARDARTWGPSGLAALRAACDRLAPALAAHGARLLLRPHARHILCDAQRCLTIMHELRERALPFGLALEPAALLEPSMLTHADDHRRRIISALAPISTLIILSTAAAPDPNDHDAPVTLLPCDPRELSEMMAELMQDGGGGACALVAGVGAPAANSKNRG